MAVAHSYPTPHLTEIQERGGRADFVRFFFLITRQSLDTPRRRRAILCRFLWMASRRPDPTTAPSPARSPLPAYLTWSPYALWCGDKPAEMCELAMYALLWLDTVALPTVGGYKATRKERCELLLSQPSLWWKMRTIRMTPIPMEELLASCKQCDAMQPFGHVLQAWTLPESLLDGVDGAATLRASWRGAVIAPRQLYIYFDTASSNTGKKGSKLRSQGGTTCRWDDPEIWSAWQMLIFTTPGVRENMVRLLALPLGAIEAQAGVRARAQEHPSPNHSTHGSPRDSLRDSLRESPRESPKESPRESPRPTPCQTPHQSPRQSPAINPPAAMASAMASAMAPAAPAPAVPAPAASVQAAALLGASRWQSDLSSESSSLPASASRSTESSSLWPVRSTAKRRVSFDYAYASAPSLATALPTAAAGSISGDGTTLVAKPHGQLCGLSAVLNSLLLLFGCAPQGEAS